MVDREEVMEQLGAIMKARGIELRSYLGWLVTDHGFPAMRGNWLHQVGNQDIGRLDVQVLLKNEQMIDESFAGLGDGEERYGDALQNFELGSLPVLLSALWGMGQDKVLVETWSSEAAAWTVHVGEYVTRCLGPEEVGFPPDLVDVLKEALMRGELEPGRHWLRTFYSNTGAGDPVVEVLLDNEKWLPGELAVMTAEWSSSEYYYSLRNFLILEPLD